MIRPAGVNGPVRPAATTTEYDPSTVLDRVTDLQTSKYSSFMFYGESGTGKTTLWGSFPGRTLVMICSGGLDPGELKSIDTPDHRKRIKQVILRHPDEIDVLCEHVRSSGDYQNVVLDHVSGFQDLVLMKILGWDKPPAQRPIMGDNKKTWGIVANDCKDKLRNFLSLPANRVIVGQQRSFGGDRSEEGLDIDVVKPTVGVAVIPSMALWLNPACDYVIQLFKRAVMVRKEVTAVKGQPPQIMYERGEGIEYCARCEPHDVYTTKFRIPKGQQLPQTIVDPDYNKLMKAIRGERVT